MFSPWLYPLAMVGSGPRNWFGDGSLGDVRITSASGAETSQDGGSTWTAITGWTRSGDVVLVPSALDGDMVVLDCRSLSIEAGMNLTTSHRCRGLLVYTQRDAAIYGTLTMTARGCHANPADAATSGDTPVAPTDGHAVPEAGITIRRLAEGQTDTDLATDLLYGCGSAAVASEARQPPASGNGIVIRIPRVGGAGAAAAGVGVTGGTIAYGAGGGGSGGGRAGVFTGGAGAAGTCFSGGGGGGGCGSTGFSQAVDADAYGASGGCGYDVSNQGSGGGAGNPGGVGGASTACDAPAYSGEDGTGGVVLLIVGGALTVGAAGEISSNGADGGETIAAGSSVTVAPGAGSGGGVVVVLYAATCEVLGSVRADGGSGGTKNGGDGGTAGAGGAGAVIGPIKIDPR